MGNWLSKWMHRNQAPDEPCPHIKPHLNGIADGSMPEGAIRRFIRHHLKDCSYCDNALFNLIVLRARIYDLGTPHPKDDELAPLDPARRAAIEAAWDAIDAQSPN